MAVISSRAELNWRVAELDVVPLGDRILMADPEYFDVLYAINPHMRDEHGALQRIDQRRARQQWTALEQAYAELGLAIDVVPPVPGFPDLVFCANQALALSSAMTGAGPAVIPARMASPERQGEVPHVVAVLERLGYAVAPLAGPAARFEATGDALLHPGRRLIWGGIGARTSAEAWDELAERYRLEIVTLRLVDPSFYHLDTCLAWLDETTCLVVESALDEQGLALIDELAERMIVVDETEARAGLAANAFCPDGRHVLLDAACSRTAQALERAGFIPRLVDTGEFKKSGGSVFCMKLFHGPLTTDRATRLA